MTKRPFPFESSIGRQFKTHVSDYENDITALRDVRERTLRKLFDGPRRLHSIVLNNEESLDLVGNERQSKNGFMQKLLTNYITVNGRKLSENHPSQLRACKSLKLQHNLTLEAPPKLFECTLNTNFLTNQARITIRAADSSPSCFFCEATTNSTHQCMQCLQFYCSNCSFVNYESMEDGRICLSCS